MGAVRQGLLSSVGRFAGRPARQFRWNALIAQADEAIARRRLAEAKAHLAQAFAVARDEWPHGERVAESALRLADLCAALERHRESRHLYVQGASILAAQPDAIDGRLVHAVSNLGRLYLLNGDARPAVELTRAATALQRTLGATDTPVLLLNRALVAAETARDAEAQLAFNDAIAALDRGAGTRDLQGVAVYENYALFCTSRNRPDDAEVLLRRCLILRQEAAGPRHPIYAAGLVNLARARLAARDDDGRDGDEIASLLWQAADICERAGTHPASGLLPALYYLARLACGRGATRDATELCNRMLDFGQQDGYARWAAEAAALHVLALMQAGGRRPAADVEGQLRRALEISRTLSGPYRTLGREMAPDLLDLLSGSLARAGKAAEAERLAGRAAEMRKNPAWALARQVFPSV